ncbi:hypothetical protein BDF21DRAFT_467948 [Thamnidium elegans]|uniref:Uncharacterized protein n=1 Tax=Thamnidium elegans TaxID=101142 RepID=A0A8H7SV41_9FUNG|nr:hypothetical protein INT48_000247 [Thamnidium elegans]KAI8056390.1 hypothetical protein BDF21DRAFT_467948 [Thamnidium elegans]
MVAKLFHSLLAFGKLTQFVEFRWCETELTSSKVLNFKKYDYNLRCAPATELIDTIGVLTTHNNMKWIIVASSSRITKENTSHSIEDTLNIFECGVSSPRKEASIVALKKLKVYEIHIIRSQVILTEILTRHEQLW